MAISINWSTRVVTIPQGDLTPLGGTLYELDVNWLRLQLKDVEDSEEGIPFPDTHRHNTTVTLSGVTYARTLEIINGYTVTFQSTGSPYTVRCAGANHNLADVTNFTTQVSLIIGNSAGLIEVATGGGGGGLTAPQAQQLIEVWREHGLDAAAPLVVTPTTRTAGSVVQTITQSGEDVTIQRT